MFHFLQLCFNFVFAIGTSGPPYFAVKAHLIDLFLTTCLKVFFGQTKYIYFLFPCILQLNVVMNFISVFGFQLFFVDFFKTI